MKFKVSQDALQRIADEAAEQLQRQIREGRNANGDPFPGGVDLRETDVFLNSIDGRLLGDEAAVVSDVRHAEFLQDKYNWAGLSPQYQAALESNVAGIIEEGLELLDED